MYYNNFVKIHKNTLYVTHKIQYHHSHILKKTYILIPTKNIYKYGGKIIYFFFKIFINLTRKVQNSVNSLTVFH